MSGSRHDCVIQEEEENVFRLMHLLYAVGTRALRRVFHQQTGLPEDPNLLHQALHEPKYRRMLGNCTALTGQQRSILDPQCNCGCIQRINCTCTFYVDSRDFDVALLVLLMSLFCKIRIPSTGSVSLPSRSDVSVRAILLRLRYVRNELSHVSRKGINNQLFEHLWNEAATALTAMGCPNRDLDEAKSIDLDHSLHDKLIKLQEQLNQVERCLDGVFWASNPVPTFYGRASDVKMLTQLLQECENKSCFYGVVIWGPSGIGKSELVRYYVQQFAAMKFDCNIIWINASSQAYLENSFIEVAEYIKLSVKDESGHIINPLAVSRRVYDFFASRKCLLIFDDASSLSNIESFFPQCTDKDKYNFSIVVTSRSSMWDDTVFELMPLDSFTPEDGERFLAGMIGQENDGSSACLLKELAARLCYFPIALQQAVAYIKQHKNVNIEKYLEMLNQLGSKLHSIRLSGMYRETLFSSMEFIFNDMNTSDKKLSYDVLCLLGYMNSGSISTTFFTKMTGVPDDETEAIFVLNEVFDIFKNYSIISSANMTQTSDDASFKMHDLVQEMIRLKIAESSAELEATTQLRLASIIKLWITGSASKQDHFDFGKFWLPHALSLLSFSSVSSVIVNLFEVFREMEKALLNSGNYSSLEHLCEKFLMTPSLNLSVDGSYQLNISLARSFKEAGRLDLALEMFSNLIGTAEDLYGKEDCRTVHSSVMMFIIYTKLKDPGLALQPLQCSLRSKRKNDNQIAMLHVRKAGALTTMEHEFGKEGHDFPHGASLAVEKQICSRKGQFLPVVYHLAVGLLDAGMTRECKAILADLIPVLVGQFGPLHCDTLKAKHMFGVALSKLHQFDEAVKVLNEVAVASVDILGAHHPNTLQVQFSLSEVFIYSRKLNEAFTLLRSLLPRVESPVGDTHALTSDIKHAYEYVSVSLGKLDSLPCDSHVLATASSGKYGDTCSSSSLRDRNFFDKVHMAHNILQQILPISERILGVEHPLSGDIKFALAAADHYKIDKNMVKRLADIGDSIDAEDLICPQLFFKSCGIS